MPRLIPDVQKQELVELLLAQDEDGSYIWGQRQIEGFGLASRPYIRKLAKIVGRAFDQNGVQILSPICQCKNCEILFRRPKSKIDRAKNNFCSPECREAFQKGANHPNFKTGSSIRTFAQWAKNQSAYQKWRKEALQLAGNKCQVSGETENLNVHHIYMKSINPEKVFDPSNALVLSEKAHKRIHELIKQNVGFEEAVELLKKEYGHVQ